MKKINFLVLLLCFALAQTTEAQTHMEVFQRSAALNDSLFLKSQMWSFLKSDMTRTGDFNGLDEPRTELESYIEQEIGYFTDLANTIDFEPLRTKTIDFLKFESKVIQTCMMPYEGLSKKDMQTEGKKIEQDCSAIREKEKTVLLEFVKAQEEYVNKNKLNTNIPALKNGEE